MNTPKVSIGLPLFNAASFLDDCLDSLISQSFTNIEIILCDNASTDDTEAICKRWCEKDSRIRYIKQSFNRGAIWNHNEVFRLSKGEYFKWMGHDDLYDPSWLGKCVNILDKDPDIVWCQSLTKHIDGQGKIIPAEQDSAIRAGYSSHSLLFAGNDLPTVTRKSETPSQRFHAIMLGTTWCSDCYGLIRSNVLRETHLYPQCYGPEKVLMAEVALHGKFEEIPEVLFYKRTHAQASGQIESNSAKKTFVHGEQHRGISIDRLTLLNGYSLAVYHSKLSLLEKARCYGSIVCYLLQFRKYKHLLFGRKQHADKQKVTQLTTP